MRAFGGLQATIAVVAMLVVPTHAYPQGSGSVTPVRPKQPALADEHLTAIRRETLPDGQRGVLEFEGEVAFREERLEKPPRILIDLKTTRVSSELSGATLLFPDGWIRLIRVGKPEGRTTRVLLELRGTPRYSVYALYNPYRIVVDVEGPAEAAPVTEVASVPLRVNEPAPPNSNGGVSFSRQLGLGISRVVIDAGHGGQDAGAQLNGLNEAEITLDVALQLEKLLKKVPGVEVVMTRRTDVFIPLEERTAIANRAGADLFLSVHVNASTNPLVRGIETYFLSFAPDSDAEAIAARENVGSSRSMHDLQDIVKAIALNNKIDESRGFATLVQNAMIERLRKADRDARNLGVKQAPFMVLIGATMPGVLAEISFLTNRQEATLLKTPNYRQAIAEALFNGISKYQRSLKSAQVASQ